MNRPTQGTNRLRSTALVSLFVSAGLAGVGCGGDDSSESEGSSSASEAGDVASVTIGEDRAESGALSFYDIPPSDAAHIAAEDLSEAGGPDYVFESQNNRSDPAQSQQVAERLLDEGVDVLFITCEYATAATAARVANGRDTVAISYCAGEPLLTKQVDDANEYTFDLGTETNGTAANMASFACAQGWKTAYDLVDTSTEYSRQTSELFNRSYPETCGGQVIGDSGFQNADASFASQINEIKSLDTPPDVLVLNSILPGAAVMVRQLRAAGIHTPILSNDAVDSASLIDSVPSLSDFYYPAAVSIYGDDPDPRVNELIKRYEQETGAPPDGFYMVYGYAMMEALDAAIDAAGSTDGPALKDALESFDDVPTIVGPLTFTEDQHVDPFRSFRIIQVQDGKQSFLERSEPEVVPDPFGEGNLVKGGG